MGRDDTWRITIDVPIRLDQAARSHLFDIVAEAVTEWEPPEEDGWDWDIDLWAGPLASVDLDDITDTAGVAEILGLSHRNSVGTYRRQYADFPEPVKNLGNGRCLLWLRPEVEAWKRSRP